MFVSTQAGHARGEADVEIAGPISARVGLRPGESGAHPLGAPSGWACPHCAVENQWPQHDAGDVVECDYCGSAFARPA